MSLDTTYALREADAHIEYDTFLSDDFDANSYANSIVNESGTGDHSDVTTALSKLSFSIDSLNKQIQREVTNNYESLLGQVRGIQELEVVLSTVQSNIVELNGSLHNLATKIRDPYDQLQTYAIQLENFQATSDILRRLHRYLLLTRRLQTQLPSQEGKLNVAERDIAAAALTVHELETIMTEPDLEGIDLVESETPLIQKSRERIDEEANRLLTEGVENQNQAKMAAGLQVYHNMKEMGERVHELTTKMLDSLVNEIKHVVDMQSLQKEIRGTGATSGPAVRRTNNEPAFGNQQVLAQAVWGRMEQLMKTMSDCCAKIYSLEKVLEIKKDSFTHASFSEEVAKALDDTNLVSHFWRILSSSFEKELKEATKVSTFLQNTFVGDYPKLLRLLHEFFARVGVHNGTLSDYTQSPEYVIMLRSFGTFESGFLARSLTRMYDTVNAAFPAHGGLSRTVPGRTSVLNVTRVIGNELGMAAFEPHLLQAVAKNAVKTLNMFCVKCEGLLPASEQAIYSAMPNNSISVSLNMNIELANLLYYMHQSVWKILEEYPEKTVDIVKQGAEDCRRLMLAIGEKLVKSVQNDAERVLLRVHQEDFSGKVSRGFDPENDGSTSGYTKELAKHVRYYHTHIFSRLSCGTEPRAWVRLIGKSILHIFLFQASIVRPLSEAGKLKLAGDMAELEFTLSQFMSEYEAKMEDLGKEYKALRAFRPLLFLDSAQLTAAHHTSDLPKIILIHHLVVRSQSSSKPLSLPGTVYDLSRREYMKWMDGQSEEETVQLALDAITKGSKLSEAELDEIPEYHLILELAS
ncbi:hypothetical protein EC973_007047 [Apophysomyces ossiformis]|uniref:Conserved oligomeric Golgi complex subunit 5 n=1 Tax=Apophysomyces ossiformis TaxID=679940 RepID=A0A8H7EUD8_9FUNG|nr:hypothetical protein EC973_007047 [Apophysomyces ossiformis]